MRQKRQTGGRAQPLTISPTKRLSVRLEQRGAFYERYFEHTNDGFSRYVVFDYVAYGGAQLGT
jgi:hypothetical protein